MIYYLVIYLFSLFVLVFSFDRHTVSINNSILVLLFSFLIIFICGSRYGIGTDYWSYYSIFKEARDYERIELGFKSLVKFSWLISPGNFSIFVFLVAFLSIFIKCIYFSKLKNPFLAVFIYVCLYYFPLDFNVIRQGLASSFIYFAVEEGRKKNLLGYLLFLCAAFLFHYTSIIFFVLYPICRKKMTFKLRNLCFVFIIFLILRISVIPFLFDFFRNLIVSKTSSSVIVQLVNYFWLSDFHFSLNFWRRLVFIITYLLIFGTRNANCYFVFYLFSFIISTMLTGNDIFSYRLSTWFDIFSIPLFCSCRIPFTRKNAIVTVCFILVLTVLFFVSMQDALPYQTSWGKI